MNTTLNTLQIKTLLDFAKNYSMDKIAQKHKVSRPTISSRLSRISKRDPKAFGNALSIRNAKKRILNNIRNPMRLSELKHEI